MLMRIVPVAFLFLVSIALLASQSVDDSSHKLLLEQINSLRSNLLHTSEANDASQWLILGHAIQAYDLRYHSGGNKMKNEALKAYDEALRLNNDKNLDMTFQINNFKGLIYKSMRKGIEALQCYDISLNLSEIPNRIAYVLSAKADIHKMLGNITTAIAMYKEAIGISSTNSLESFLSLAKCYKEIKADRALSIELLNDIEMMIKKFDDEDMIIPSTGILWAAFEV
jgi:tetratricopeptide (TPR) repeat protein